MKKFILSLVLVLSGLTASAQQYGALATLWNNSTNVLVPAQTTNIAGIVGCARYDSFTLEVSGGYTNAQIGTLDLHWCASADGVTYCNIAGQSGGSGTIVIPLTNRTAFYFCTNITVGSFAYWQIDVATNNGSHLSNCVIKVWGKPRRNG